MACRATNAPSASVTAASSAACAPASGRGRKVGAYRKLEGNGPASLRRLIKYSSPGVPCSGRAASNSPRRWRRRSRSARSSASAASSASRSVRRHRRQRRAAPASSAAPAPSVGLEEWKTVVPPFTLCVAPFVPPRVAARRGALSRPERCFSTLPAAAGAVAVVASPACRGAKGSPARSVMAAPPASQQAGGQPRPGRARRGSAAS